MQALAKVDIDALLKARLDYQHWLEFEQQAPAYYITPRGKKVPITYQMGQLPKVSIALQELFGQMESPALAWNSTRLSFELLSPAQRPIQTTSDLAQFWQGSYVDIAKEMRGRYPKHRWPENPLQEEAGQSLKRRS